VGQGKTKGTRKEPRRIEQIPEHIKRLENTRWRKERSPNA